VCARVSKAGFTQFLQKRFFAFCDGSLSKIEKKKGENENETV
jgi:hypothetical protein